MEEFLQGITIESFQNDGENSDENTDQSENNIPAENSQ